MTEEIKEKISYLEGQFILTSSDIAELMAEEEAEMEKTQDESEKAIIKERLEKYEELSSYFDEAEGLLAELRIED